MEAVQNTYTGQANTKDSLPRRVGCFVGPLFYAVYIHRVSRGLCFEGK